MTNWFFRAALLLPLALIPLGCGKTSVVGVWKGHNPGQGPFQEGYLDVMLYFKADGTMGGTIGGEGYAGTWSVNGDQLTMDAKSKDGVLHDTEKFSISGGIMTIETFQLTGNKLDLFRDDD
jgi:hypothetical protein